MKTGQIFLVIQIGLKMTPKTSFHWKKKKHPNFLNVLFQRRFSKDNSIFVLIDGSITTSEVKLIQPEN